MKQNPTKFEQRRKKMECSDIVSEAVMSADKSGQYRYEPIQFQIQQIVSYII